ncbi:MAG: NUDIX hydrolase [Azospirillaceae bacterium]|nr:NUDIX hydrolase [Azospirillaceae bacterium]
MGTAFLGKWIRVEKHSRTQLQVAALPLRSRNGHAEVLLITSRETRRWVIPKGWTEARLKSSAQAAQEALEEAGLVGTISKRPIGTYSYRKVLTPDKSVPCVVAVFRLDVTAELDDWLERGQREKRWMPLATAASLVDEPELAALLLKVDTLQPASACPVGGTPVSG